MNTQELIEMTRVIRKDIVTMVYEAGSGHPGGSLMAALYFGNVLKVRPAAQ